MTTKLAKKIRSLKAQQAHEELVLCTSRGNTGGWSLHAPGSTDADIAIGDAPYLVCGGSGQDANGKWLRPNAEDYANARAILATWTAWRH